MGPAGHRYYVIVAWIWSLLFYLGLDPLKWAMALAMSKSGMHRLTTAPSKVGRPGLVLPRWHGPLSRWGRTGLLVAKYTWAIPLLQMGLKTVVQTERACVLMQPCCCTCLLVPTRLGQ